MVFSEETYVSFGPWNTIFFSKHLLKKILTKYRHSLYYIWNTIYRKCHELHVYQVYTSVKFMSGKGFNPGQRKIRWWWGARAGSQAGTGWTGRQIDRREITQHILSDNQPARWNVASQSTSWIKDLLSGMIGLVIRLLWGYFSAPLLGSDKNIDSVTRVILIENSAT